MDRVIQRLYRELPRFESWLEQYRTDPAPIEEVLLGFRIQESQGASGPNSPPGSQTSV